MDNSQGDGNESEIDFIQVDSQILGASKVKALDESVIYDKFTEDEASRIIPALSKSMFVFPVAPSIYKVYNYKEQDVNILEQQETENYSEYRVSFPSEGKEVCTCYDFTLNVLSKEDVLATRCKHIWRVLFELHVNNVPPIGVCPYQWLLNKTERRLLRLAEKPNEKVGDAKELKELREYLKGKTRLTVDYEIAYRKWQVLSKRTEFEI